MNERADIDFDTATFEANLLGTEEFAPAIPTLQDQIAERLKPVLQTRAGVPDGADFAALRNGIAARIEQNLQETNAESAFRSALLSGNREAEINAIIEQNYIALVEIDAPLQVLRNAVSSIKNKQPVDTASLNGVIKMIADQKIKLEKPEDTVKALQANNIGNTAKRTLRLALERELEKNIKTLSSTKETSEQNLADSLHDFTQPQSFKDALEEFSYEALTLSKTTPQTEESAQIFFDLVGTVETLLNATSAHDIALNRHKLDSYVTTLQDVYGLNTETLRDFQNTAYNLQFQESAELSAGLKAIEPAILKAITPRIRKDAQEIAERLSAIKQNITLSYDGVEILAALNKGLLEGKTNKDIARTSLAFLNAKDGPKQADEIAAHLGTLAEFGQKLVPGLTESLSSLYHTGQEMLEAETPVAEETAQVEFAEAEPVSDPNFDEVLQVVADLENREEEAEIQSDNAATQTPQEPETAEAQEPAQEQPATRLTTEQRVLASLRIIGRSLGRSTEEMTDLANAYNDDNHNAPYARALADYLARIAGFVSSTDATIAENAKPWAQSALSSMVELSLVRTTNPAARKRRRAALETLYNQHTFLTGKTDIPPTITLVPELTRTELAASLKDSIKKSIHDLREDLGYTKTSLRKHVYQYPYSTLFKKLDRFEGLESLALFKDYLDTAASLESSRDKNAILRNLWNYTKAGERVQASLREEMFDEIKAHDEYMQNPLAHEEPSAQDAPADPAGDALLDDLEASIAQETKESVLADMADETANDTQTAGADTPALPQFLADELAKRQDATAPSAPAQAPSFEDEITNAYNELYRKEAALDGDLSGLTNDQPIKKAIETIKNTDPAFLRDLARYLKHVAAGTKGLTPQKPDPVLEDLVRNTLEDITLLAEDQDPEVTKNIKADFQDYLNVNYMNDLKSQRNPLYRGMQIINPIGGAVIGKISGATKFATTVAGAAATRWPTMVASAGVSMGVKGALLGGASTLAVSNMLALAAIGGTLGLLVTSHINRSFNDLQPDFYKNRKEKPLIGYYTNGLARSANLPIFMANFAANRMTELGLGTSALAYTAYRYTNVWSADNNFRVTASALWNARSTFTTAYKNMRLEEQTQIDAGGKFGFFKRVGTFVGKMNEIDRNHTSVLLAGLGGLIGGALAPAASHGINGIDNAVFNGAGKNALHAALQTATGQAPVQALDIPVEVQHAKPLLHPGQSLTEVPAEAQHAKPLLHPGQSLTEVPAEAQHAKPLLHPGQSLTEVPTEAQHAKPLAHPGQTADAHKAVIDKARHDEIMLAETDIQKAAAFLHSSKEFAKLVEHIEKLKAAGVIKGADAKYFDKLIDTALSDRAGSLAAARELSNNISEGGIFEQGGHLRRIPRMPIDRLKTPAAIKAGYPGGLARSFMEDMDAKLHAPADIKLKGSIARVVEANHQALNGKAIDGHTQLHAKTPARLPTAEAVQPVNMQAVADGFKQQGYDVIQEKDMLLVSETPILKKLPEPSLLEKPQQILTKLFKGQTETPVTGYVPIDSVKAGTPAGIAKAVELAKPTLIKDGMNPHQINNLVARISMGDKKALADLYKTTERADLPAADKKAYLAALQKNAHLTKLDLATIPVPQPKPTMF